MCASESCSSSYDAQPSTRRNVNWALFPCHGKISPLFQPRLFKNVVAQFIGLSICHCEADEVSRSNPGR